MCHGLEFYIGVGAGAYGHVELLGEFEVEAFNRNGSVSDRGHAGLTVS